MKRSDRFLVVIVIGIVLLVVVAFVVALTRPEATYKPEDTPEGVAHNYLLALEKEEYARAYGYLSPDLPNYPTSLNEFTREVDDNPWRFRANTDATLVVQDAVVRGDLATVSVYETRFYRGDFLDSGQSYYAFEIELEGVDGAWKIVDAPYYFAWCWARGNGCN